MNDQNSLLLQRVAVFRSQLKNEKTLPRTETLDTLVSDLENAVRLANNESAVKGREMDAILRQNQELKRRNDALNQQKEHLEQRLESLERQYKTLERHNTNLLRQNHQIEHYNAALEEKRIAVEAQRSRLRELFDYAPEAYVLTDSSGAIQDCNSASAEMLNTSPRELKGGSLASFMSPGYQQLFQTLLTRLQRIKDIEVCIRPHGKAEVDASLTLSTFYDDTGKPTLLLWLLRDITERRRAMSALNASERRFRTVFNEASLGIVLIDLTGRIIRANRAMQEMLGFSEQELFNRLVTDLTCPDDAPIANVWLTLPENGRGNFFLENRFRRRDGQYIWTSVSLSVLRDETGQAQYVMGMIKNISAEKQTAIELAEMRRKLLESGEVERMRLAQSLHDGPTQDLYSANFLLSNFLNGNSQPVPVDSLIPLQDMLREVANHLRDIVGELRPPTIGNLGLERAIRSHAERVQEQHPELEIKLHLTRDGQALPPHTRLAFFRIYQHCMANILRHAQANQAVVAFHLNETEISLDIWDNGKGFSVPGKWVDLARDGRYGLASIAERVQALSGTLNIESKVGSGALVHITAPLQKES